MLEVPLRADREFQAGSSLSQSTRILIAVSSAAERESISRLCIRSGAETDAVGKAAAALRLIKDQPERYEMLILDCRLPDHGGFALIEDLSELPHTPRILALLPMDHRPNDMETCRRFNVDALIKPVRESRLRNWIVNPASTEPSEGTVSAEPYKSHDLSGLRILHADDSADNRMLIDAYLRNQGCELVEVSDGAAAVEAFTDREFDVVLMDVQMPRMSGLEATKRIREIEARTGAPPIPILALTANAFKEQADECFAAGASQHLSKPISASTLLEAISATRCDSSENARDEMDSDLYEVDPEIADLVPGYLERRSEEVAVLRAALDEDAFETVRRIGHNLKGTGGGYGMNVLSEVGARLEQAGANADRDAAKNEINDLENLVRKLTKIVSDQEGA